MAAEYRAYFRRSVTASTLVGLAFLLLDALLLSAMFRELARFPRHPLDSLLPLAPIASILAVAAGHFTWAYRLRKYKRVHGALM